MQFNALDEKQQTVLTLLSSQVKRVFVTGAGGFLGYALCRHLRTADIEVVGFARSDYPALRAIGVILIRGDIAEQQVVLEAMRGSDVVFHVASKAGIWGSKASYFQANVCGTKNIIEACRVLDIRRLVYTSTPSVTFDGADENGINESTPYAVQFLNFYGLSKAIAEQHILNANGAMLKTVALRPHLIWGPGDPHLAPRVLQRAAAGKLKLVGKVDKLVDTTYIDNAVYAHLLAAVKLNEASPICAGKPYFISNDEPILMADMLNKILACKGLAPVTQRVPAWLAYGLGTLLEWIYLGLRKEQEPMMTRFVARQLSTSHYFDIRSAKDDLGYQPLVSIEQGMEKLKAALR
jgi:nucleoside-diphosphate-sugar epimerase